MLKFTRIFIALGIGALTSAETRAQANITIYGSIDEGVTLVNNVAGSRLFKMDDSVSQGNRIGFKGQENLGGGSSIIFSLENGFNSDTGAIRQQGQLFGRQAYIGLANKLYGTVTLGRGNDQMNIMLISFHASFLTGIYGFTPGDLNRVAGNFLNNMVTYNSPKIGGFQVNVQYSFSEDGASITNAGRAFSAGTSYVRGAFSAATAVTGIKGYTITPAGTGLANMFGTDLRAAPTTAFALENYLTAGIGVKYKFDNLSIAALYTNTLFELRKNVSNTMNTGSVSGTYSITPTLSMTTGYSFSKIEASRWHNLSWITDCYLSKRTDVYASLNYQRAIGGNSHAALYTNPASFSGSQFALRAGMRYLF